MKYDYAKTEAILTALARRVRNMESYISRYVIEGNFRRAFPAGVSARCQAAYDFSDLILICRSLIEHGGYPTGAEPVGRMGIAMG